MQNVWQLAVMWFRRGASGSSPSGLLDWKSALVRGAPGLFPPELVVQIKAWACELPSAHKLPLSRWSTSDLVRAARGSRVGRFYQWQHADGVAHAPTRAALAPAVSRLFSTLRRAATQRSEAERRQEWRRGTQSACATSSPTNVCQKCGRDVHHARVFGRCEADNGNDARRVFWIVDNCSVHRGQREVERLRERYLRRPQLQLVHAPTHASWLNRPRSRSSGSSRQDLAELLAELEKPMTGRTAAI